MPERYCDALIIGTDLSGLITAAFLARRGLTVHVLDLDPYSRNEKEPDPFCVAHLHSKLLRSILGRLNVPEGDIQLLSNTDSPLQVIFPDRRIDISANPSLFYEELEREFPNQHEQIKSFYENLSMIKHAVETQELYSLMLPTSFSEKRQWNKFVKTHGLDRKLDQVGLPFQDNPSIKSFILSQLKLLTYTHTDTPFAFQVAEMLNPNEGEILSVQGGHQHLKKLFLSRIEHHEGVYRPEAAIESLLFKNGIVEGVKLAGFEGNILSRYVIWNTQLKRLPDYLPKLWRFRSLKKAITNLKPSAYWFTASYELPAALIPEPMGNNLLCIREAGGDLKGGNFLYLQVKNRDQETATVSVSYLLDATASDWLDRDFDSLHREAKDFIEFLIPFAVGKVRLAFPVINVAQDQDTLFPLNENDFEIFKKTAISHPVYFQQAKSFADLFPINYKTAAPNFFLTSPEILASMGYEGKFMLGLKVTDLIWSDVEKEKKRAMKQERRIA